MDKIKKSNEKQEIYLPYLGTFITLFHYYRHLVLDYRLSLNGSKNGKNQSFHVFFFHLYFSSNIWSPCERIRYSSFRRLLITKSSHYFRFYFSVSPYHSTTSPIPRSILAFLNSHLAPSFFRGLHCPGSDRYPFDLSESK